MIHTSKSRTVTDIVQRAQQCQNYGARFLSRVGKEEFYSYSEVAHRAKLAAGYLQQIGLKPGDRVVLILPTSIQFFDAMLGVQLAGGITAAIYPPFRFGKLNEYLNRLNNMMTSIGTRFVITDNRIRKILGAGVCGVTSIEKVLDVSTLLKLGDEKLWKSVPAHDDDLAFLQFSSGTTLEPKAVTVTHQNLIENLEMMKIAISPFSEEDQANGAVCWLPLYHDMGLVGNLYMGLYYPGTITYMGPEVFIAKPAMWLQALSRYRAVISTAPNFAYSMCVKKVSDEDMQGVDLSSWRMALNGAEPINHSTLQAFAQRFEKWGFSAQAITPVYGLAEAVLAVSFSGMKESPKITEFDRDTLSLEGRATPTDDGRVIVSVGRVLPGLEVQIHDPEHRSLPDTHVGNIVIKGPSVSKGYYAKKELTNQTIHNEWLDTGDLGFLFEDNLYICGRVKDVIIIRGRNYAPQEIEDLLTDIDGLRLGCAVAVSTQVQDIGEELIILAEKDGKSKRSEDEIIADIGSQVTTGISLIPYHIEILRPGTLPRTSSGKLQHKKALDQFLAGELVPPETVNALKLLKDFSKSQLSWAKFRLQHRRNSKKEDIC